VVHWQRYTEIEGETAEEVVHRQGSRDEREQNTTMEKCKKAGVAQKKEAD
jgi:hypothetical protein